MCLITEHARLKQQYKALNAEKILLEAKIKELQENTVTFEAYADYVRSQVDEILIQEMTWYELIDMLKDKHNLENMLSHPPDHKKRFTDEETMIKIVPFLTYPADYYIAELEINCDDYARWAAADMRRIFRLQGVFEVWGNTPYGYHAWCMTVVGPDKVKYFEPNAGFPFAGELFDAGGYGFIPEKWK